MASNEVQPPTDPGVQGELRHDRFVGGQDLTRWKSPPGRFLANLAQRVAARLGPNAALILTLAIGALIAIIMTAVFAQVYDSVTEADGVAGLDHPLLAAAKSIRSPGFDIVMTAYTNVGGTIGMPILGMIATVTLALRRRSWTPVILILTAAAGSLLMTIAGKPLFGRARPSLSDAIPPYEHSAAFPSGHALNSFVIAGIVAYLIVLRQRTRRGRVLTVAVAALFALTMGLSRVYLGHHWFTDVLSAWALGAAWLALVITAHRLYLTIRKRRTPDPG
ncbi:phosphatase PAP2 family protein [Arthrobacter sp. A5]|uniref:phosphatase PAP2 family protein n=1 Tax=Arthrobacter sp. A5 TaxID=576926 RepID=UPI003DA9C573